MPPSNGGPKARRAWALARAPAGERHYGRAQASTQQYAISINLQLKQPTQCNRHRMSDATCPSGPGCRKNLGPPLPMLGFVCDGAVVSDRLWGRLRPRIPFGRASVGSHTGARFPTVSASLARHMWTRDAHLMLTLIFFHFLSPRECKSRASSPSDAAVRI